MIISHRHRFVYVRTRKTASSSVEIALSRFCGPEDIITRIGEQDLRRSLGYPGPQNTLVHSPCGGTFELMNHAPALVARDLLGKRWRSYFTFTMERNPFDRAISDYFWRTRGLANPPSTSRFLRDGGLRPNWPIYTDRDTLIVDFVGRYETLEDSLDHVSRQLGLGETITLPAVKAKSEFRQDRRHYRDVLTEEDRRIIERVCRREIEEFGYAW